MFWNMAWNTGADGTVIWVGIGYSRLLWTIADWVAKKASLWSWGLSRILNRRIQPRERLRIDSVEKELRKCKGPQDTYEEGKNADSSATVGCKQTQWEEKEAAGDKSDRSNGVRTYSRGMETHWRLELTFLLRMWPETSYFQFATASIKWTS